MFTEPVDCNYCDEHFGPSLTWAPVYRHMRDNHPEIWDKDTDLRNEATKYGVK